MDIHLEESQAQYSSIRDLEDAAKLIDRLLDGEHLADVAYSNTLCRKQEGKRNFDKYNNNNNTTLFQTAMGP